jgi:hypothetical protein
LDDDSENEYGTQLGSKSPVHESQAVGTSPSRSDYEESKKKVD